METQKTESAKIDFKVNPPIDNTLKIVLGVLGGVALAFAVGAIGFFAYKRNQGNQELNKKLDSMLESPTAINPTDLEKKWLIREKEDQPSSCNCQLF